MSLERFLTYGLALLLLAAPLPFGSVEPGPASLLTASCLVLGAVWTVWRSRRGLPALPWRDPVLRAGALFALIGLVQLIPLPRAVLQTVSPKAVELRERYEPQTLLAGTAPAVSGAAIGWRPISLYPWATRQSVLRFLACLLAALMTIDLVTQAHGSRTLGLAVVAAGGFQALYGLAEFFSGHQQIFAFAKKYSTDAATGTFINPNHYAGFLEMTLPLALALAAALVVDAGENPLMPAVGSAEESRGRRMFAASILLILCLVMATALACSGSRMGIVSALLAILVVGILAAWRGRRRSFAAAAAVVVLVTGLLLSRSQAGISLLQGFSSAGTELAKDLGRWSIWSQSAGMAAAFPLAGVGLGVFPHLFPAFRTSGEGVSLRHAHNDYLEFAAEAGLAGCLLAAMAFLLVARRMIHRSEHFSSPQLLGYAAATGGLALALHSLTDFNLAIPSNALVLSVLIGMVVGWVQGPLRALASGTRTPRPRAAWLAAACAAGGALLALAPLVSEVWGGAEAAQRLADEPLAVERGSGGERLAELLDGDNAQRLSDSAHARGVGALRDLHTLIQTQKDAGPVSQTAASYLEHRLAEAARLQAAALRHLPTSAAGHLTLGRLRVGECAAAALGSGETGDCAGAALPELRLALELGPMSARTHAHVAQFLMAAWPVLDEAQRSESEPIIERAARMNRADTELRQKWALIGGDRGAN